MSLYSNLHLRSYNIEQYLLILNKFYTSLKSRILSHLSFSKGESRKGEFHRLQGKLVKEQFHLSCLDMRNC
jgi:hypothetical protein